jgi:hypothetical protein
MAECRQTNSAHKLWVEDSARLQSGVDRTATHNDLIRSLLAGRCQEAIRSAGGYLNPICGKPSRRVIPI